MDYKKKLNELYREARSFVSQGKQDEAIAVLEKFIYTACVYWKEHQAPEKKTEMKARIIEWAAVTKIIQEKGISDDIRKKFTLKPQDITAFMAMDWEAEVFEKCKASVVRLSSGESVGTGFIISENGYLLTNEHVVANRNNLWMSFAGGDESYRVCIIVADKKRDVALCKFEHTDISVKFTSIPCIKDYSKMRQGDKIMIIGNAKGRGLAPVPGTIRYLSDEHIGDLVSTIPANGGDSGSPVLNRSGECIGIHKSSDIDAKGFAYATPMDEIEKLLKKWIESHKINL